MYVDFFGLRELPFNNTPDPRFFFSTHDHEEALASLIYAVEARKGFVLLTGEVGAGKTLVSRLMLRHFGPRIAFANVNHAVQSDRDLVEAVCTEFDLDVPNKATHAQLVRLLHDFLLERFSQNVPVVLVLDEAQNVPIDAFEQLRMIGNLEADDAKLLQICIVGQPELQTRFSAPALRQLRQRLYRSYHLPALNREATEGYIRHRLSVSGGKIQDVFTPDAIDRVFHLSRGLPRLINTICDNAMLSAYAADNRTIDEEFVLKVTAQMMLVEDDGPTASKRQPPARAPEHDARPSAAAPTGRSDRATSTPVPTDDPRPPAPTHARTSVPRPKRAPPNRTPRFASRTMLDQRPDRIVNLVRSEFTRLRTELSWFVGHAVRRVDALEEQWRTRGAACERASAPHDGPNDAPDVVKHAAHAPVTPSGNERDSRVSTHEAHANTISMPHRRDGDAPPLLSQQTPSAADVDAVVRRLDADARTASSLLRAWRTSEMKSSTTVPHVLRAADTPACTTAETASKDIGPSVATSRDAYLARLQRVINTMSEPAGPRST